MRDIRFRAWDKRKKKMWYAKDLKDSKSLWAVGFHGLPIAVDEGSFKENEIVGWNIDHFLELMQYTGLKDKNGKEIYIGDIVKHYDNRIRKVQWIDTTMDTGVSDFVTDGECGSPDPEDIEVIGNIYEDGELLEDKP